MGRRTSDTVTSEATSTSNVTPVDVVVSVAILDGAAFHSELVLVGRDGSGNSVRCRISHGGKVVAGVLSLEGVQGTLMAMVGNALLTGSIPAIVPGSGTSIKGQVTGILATTITWEGWLTVWVN